MQREVVLFSENGEGLNCYREESFLLWRWLCFHQHSCSWGRGLLLVMEITRLGAVHVLCWCKKASITTNRWMLSLPGRFCCGGLTPIGSCYFFLPQAAQGIGAWGLCSVHNRSIHVFCSGDRKEDLCLL